MSELYKDRQDATLCEALDRLLHRGVALHGDILIRVADVDLVYLNLRVLLCSVDRAIASGALPSPQRNGGKL